MTPSFLISYRRLKVAERQFAKGSKVGKIRFNNRTKSRHKVNFSIPGLNRERQDLKRLLKEDVNDVCSSNVPLHTLQMSIDNSLKELREKLVARREEISSLLVEQEALCDGKLN